jgi:hypothetical protein
MAPSTNDVEVVKIGRVTGTREDGSIAFDNYLVAPLQWLTVEEEEAVAAFSDPSREFPGRLFAAMHPLLPRCAAGGLDGMAVFVQFVRTSISTTTSLAQCRYGGGPSWN